MPDLITHVSIAYIITKIGRFSRFRVLFYIGTILPDIISRPFYIIFPPSIYYVYSLHSPVMMILITLLFAHFFDKLIRKEVVFYLLFGVGIHFLLDLFQKHILDAYYWLFPLSWHTFDLGLFWPEDSLRLIPFWLLLVLIIEGSIQVKLRAQRQRSEYNAF